jgi:phosphoenolpyruvate-protein kinase (PTS system EI component)
MSIQVFGHAGVARCRDRARRAGGLQPRRCRALLRRRRAGGREVARLRHARDAVAANSSRAEARLPPEAPAELAALLDVHLMLLHDDR